MVSQEPNQHVDNLYELLEVSPRARPVVIKSAYGALKRAYRNEADMAKRLTCARDVLLDPGLRAEYDNQRLDLTGNIVGNYRILEMIAQGGFGKTYKGEHVLLKEPVCIKHPHYTTAEDEQVLVEEARALWDLRHFSLPAMRDLIELSDGSHAIVMSYVPGPTLEEIVQKVGKVDPEHVAWIAERCLNALKYLHYNGVVHGDVKPQNIIIQPDNHTVVLVDYGLAAIRPAHKDSNKGYTPVFASPEQERGDIILPESDFYSLGQTMIYALGGDITKRQVPAYVPDRMCQLIKRFIVYDVLARPNWDKEDLCSTIADLRVKEFGRRSTNMKPIPGL